MKDRNSILLVCAFFIFISFSCTVSKRLYEPGYYVDWHTINRNSLQNPVRHKKDNILVEINSTPINKVSDQPELLSSLTTETNPQLSLIIGEPESKTFLCNDVNIAQEVDFSVLSNSAESKAEDPITEPVIHWAAGLSLGLGILGFVFPFFLSIAAIVFGIIALTSIKANPEKYKGAKLATAGIIVGVLGLVLLITFFALILASFG